MNQYRPMTLKEMISNILTVSPWTEQGIANRIGCSQPTVHRIKTGETKDTSHSVGVNIEALHKEVFSKYHKSDAA